MSSLYWHFFFLLRFLQTDMVKKRRHTCREIEAEERRYEAKARQLLGLELQNQEIVFSPSSSSASSSASSAPPPASEPWRIHSERCLVVLLLFCELMLDSISSEMMCDANTSFSQASSEFFILCAWIVYGLLFFSTMQPSR
eukprot:g6286.t1